MRIAITGERGFLGYHISQYLTYQLKHTVVSLGRDYQKQIDKIKDCDWLIHCAGVNRGVDVGKSNINIANELVYLLESNDISVNLVFISSTQEKYDNEYGNSKRECSIILKEYCQRKETEFIKYEVPNLFGPFGKPNYNSVVATFCYNAVQGLESKVSEDEVNLCYVIDAVKVISSFKPNIFEVKKVSVKALHDLIKGYHDQYSLGIIPLIEGEFELNLFNTYRSFAPCKHNLSRKTDNRGYLIELVKSMGSESQVFFSVTKPGITRGNHFHFRKIERFCILSGEAKVCMRKVGEDSIESYYISGETDSVIDMPVLYTHNITNVGKEDLICVFWCNEIFNQEDPDTYFLEV